MDSCLSLSSEEWLCAPAVTDATWHAPPPLSHLSSADTLLQQVSSFDTDSADLVSDLTLSDVFFDDLFSDSAILFSSSASPSPLSLFDGSPHTAPIHHLSPVTLSPTVFVKQESPPPPSSPPLPLPLYNDSSLTHSVSHHSASASSHPLSQCATLDQCPTEQLSSPAPLPLSQSTAATLPSHYRQPVTELRHHPQQQQQQHPLHHPQQQQQRLSSSPHLTSNIQSSTMKSSRCQSLSSADTSNNNSSSSNNISSNNNSNNNSSSSSSNCTNQIHQSLQLTRDKGSSSNTSGHVSPSLTASSLLSPHCPLSLSLSACDVISDDTRPAHTPPTVRPAAGKDKCDAPRGLFGAHSSVTAKCRGVKIMVKPAALSRAATTGATTTHTTVAAAAGGDGGGTATAAVTVTVSTARVSSRNAVFQSPVLSGFKVEHNTTTASSAINSSATSSSTTSSSLTSPLSTSLSFSSSSSKSSSSSSSTSSSKSSCSSSTSSSKSSSFSSSISSSKSSSSCSTSSSKSLSSSTSSSKSSSSSTPFSTVSSGANEEQLRLMVPGTVAGQQVRRRLVLRVSADHLRLIRSGVIEVVVRSPDLDHQPSEAEECALPAEQKHYQPNHQQQQQHQQEQYEPDYSELACFSDGDEWLVPLESLPALANMTAPLTTPASSYHHQHHQQQQQQQLPPADEDGMHGQLLLPDDLQDLVLDTDDLARLPLHSANTILDDLMSSGDTNSSHSSVSNSLQLTPSPQSHTLSVVDDIGCLSDSGVDIGDSGCTSLPPLHPSPHEQQQQQSGFGKRRVSVCHKRRRTAAAAGAAVAVHKRSTPYSRSHTPPPAPAAAAAPKPATAAFSDSSSPSSVAAAAAAKSALTEEQRRERKRQQNKLAATRYRQKKRQEMTVVAVDEDQLEQRNRQLKERVLSLTKELDYLRQLMRQVLLHKQVV